MPNDAILIKARNTQYTWIISRRMATQYLHGSSPAPTKVVTLVEMLPKWEKDILQEVYFIIPEQTVWGTLCWGKCYAASDGLAPKGWGSFGLILSDKRGEHLTQCQGPVFNYAISLYRAEASGMLSFFHFLIRMTKMHQRDGHQAQSPYLVCNNQSLVWSVDKMTKFSTIFPNTTMDVEWDCLAQILQAIKSLGEVLPNIDHIAGHQDKDTPYGQLSLPAQFNCNANTLAAVYLHDNPLMEHKHSPIFLAGELIMRQLRLS